MSMHIVRAIKKYNHNQVANAMYYAGYSFVKRRPTNIQAMVHTLPRCALVIILNRLRET